MSGVVSVLVIVVIGAVILGNSFIHKQGATLSDLKLENTVLQEQQTALIKAKKDIEQYQELEQIAKTVVPQDKDQAKAVREIVAIATLSGIRINTIQFPASTLGSAPAASAPAAPEESEAPETPAAKPAPPISQAAPVEGIQGVYSLSMNITPQAGETSNITYYQFLDFLERLEKNRRTAQVTSIGITPRSSNVENPILDFTLSINIFIKP